MGKQLALFDLPEVWMEVRDHEFFQEVIDDSPYTRRELAALIGWKSHGYLNKLYSGKANTLKPEPAVRLARFVGARVDRLFVTQTSDESAQVEALLATKRQRKAPARTKPRPAAGGLKDAS
jgi:hypothetical protein